jgi:DNA polymerase-1
MPRTLLAVDLSYQTYRAAAARQNLSSADGTFTGGLYGFLVSLAAMIRETEATQVLICQDVRPYRRSLEYPEYKMLRKSTQDPALKEQVNVSIQQILTACQIIGLPTAGVPGFESDDIIGHFARRHRHRYETIYAASNDSDLFQLLTIDNFRVYRKDKTDIVDRAALSAISDGLDPTQFMLASALQGTHNDIAGIPRVGLKTACKAVKQPELLRQYRERWASVIDRNLRLIQLPHRDFPADFQMPQARTFSHRDLYRFCARYDIEVTSNMLDSFEAVCP